MWPFYLCLPSLALKHSSPVSRGLVTSWQCNVTRVNTGDHTGSPISWWHLLTSPLLILMTLFVIICLLSSCQPGVSPAPVSVNIWLMLTSFIIRDKSPQEILSFCFKNIWHESHETSPHKIWNACPWSLYNTHLSGWFILKALSDKPEVNLSWS